MKAILRLKHWQILLITVGLILLQRALVVPDPYGRSSFDITLTQIFGVFWMVAAAFEGARKLIRMGHVVKNTFHFMLNVVYGFVFLFMYKRFGLEEYRGFDWNLVDFSWSIAWVYVVYAGFQTLWYVADIISRIDYEGNSYPTNTFLYCVGLIIPIVNIFVFQPVVNKWFDPGPETAVDDGSDDICPV